MTFCNTVLVLHNSNSNNNNNNKNSSNAKEKNYGSLLASVSGLIFFIYRSSFHYFLPVYPNS